MEKTQNTNLLNNITFDIVKDQAIKDRTKEYMEDLQAQQKTSVKSKTKEELVDLDEVDSEEERIMRKELERRMGETQHRREITKKKLSEKYGDYREIIETEFLDTMLKNKKVVCHFYHKEFERCKIMDNHLLVFFLKLLKKLRKDFLQLKLLLLVKIHLQFLEVQRHQQIFLIM